MTDELAELRARVARLEAERAAISTFNEYLYNMDIGYTDAILDVFTEDALLEVINFPPGTMQDLELSSAGARPCASSTAPIPVRSPRFRADTTPPTCR